jgi:hypothetical protein
MTEADIEKFVNEKYGTQGKGIDPFTIITIITLLWKAYQLYKACKVPKELLKNNVRRNGLASRIFFRKQVYDKLIEKGIDPDTALQMTEDAKKEFLEKE